MLQYDLLPGQPGAGLVVVLHGLGDSPRGWRPVAAELRLPDPTWVFLQAPLPYYEGFSWFAIPGTTAPEHGPEDLARDLRRSRKLLSATMTLLQQETGVPATETVLAGFSQGCVMVADHALRSDQRYAGVVCLSGWLAAADEYPAAFGAAVQEQRFFWAHGDADSLLPVDASEAQVRQLQAAGLQIDWRRYPVAHSVCMPELEAVRAFLARCLPPAAAKDL